MTDKKPSPKSDITGMPFEQAIKELEAIVGKLETGDVPLDQSITAYERGTLLKEHCESLLAGARQRIEKISLSPSGAAATEPLTSAKKPQKE